MRRYLLPVVGAAALVLAGGCGEHRLPARVDPEPAQEGTEATSAASGPPTATARIRVTDGFGARVLLDVRVDPGSSVLAGTQAFSTVETSYDGAFVQSINGVAGDRSTAVDWLYFVNGVEATVGAAAYRLGDGDEAWWDRRSWNPYLHVTAVVGAWPEPFVHGYGDGEPPTVQAAPPLDAVLRDQGAHVVATGGRYRVVIGADARLQADEPAWRDAVLKPRAAGLLAWFDDGVAYVAAPAGKKPAVVPTATAVVAIVPAEGADRSLLMVVSGLTDRDARSAAAAIATDATLLSGHYAVALDAAGRVVGSGGRGQIEG